MGLGPVVITAPGLRILLVCRFASGTLFRGSRATSSTYTICPSCPPQPDGRLVLTAAGSSEVWSLALSSLPSGNYSAVLQDDGVLALTAADGTEYWKSGG